MPNYPFAEWRYKNMYVKILLNFVEIRKIYAIENKEKTWKILQKETVMAKQKV